MIEALTNAVLIGLAISILAGAAIVTVAEWRRMRDQDRERR